MSRIGEALKRAGAPDGADGLEELFVAADVEPITVAKKPSPVPVDAVPPTSVERLSVTAADVPLPLPGETPEDASLPPLGVLDTAEKDAAEKLVANPSLSSFAVEQYRRLAAILHHTQEARGIRKVLIGSALAGEGKTLTAINLALTLSQSYARRVLLIDADLRRPGVSHVFGFPHGAGLSEALHSEEPQKLSLIHVSETFAILPAGRPTSDPMAGLTSPRMAQILDEAAQQFDWVIIDSPPIGLLTDAKLLAAMADGALLVIAASRTPFDALRRAAEALGRDRLLGVVLNRVSEKAVSPVSYYHYHYGYYYGSERGRQPGLFTRLFKRK